MDPARRDVYDYRPEEDGSAMAFYQHQPFAAVGRVCRTVATAVIAGVARRTGFHEIEARLLRLPDGQAAAIVSATLAFLLVLAIVAAQFGWVGLAVYFVAIIAIVG
ncbi:MAG: hypothetical protein AAF914_02745 [Pseudomonadota bacterium]